MSRPIRPQPNLQCPLILRENTKTPLISTPLGFCEEGLKIRYTVKIHYAMNLKPYYH